MLATYPTDESRAATGSVRGRVRCGEAACPASVAVTLLEPETGAVLGGLADAEGNYNVTGVPPGQYAIYAGSYPGDPPPAELPAPGWKPVFFGGNEAPVRMLVAGSGTASADIVAVAEAPPFRLEWAFCDSMSWFDVFASGRSWDCRIRGRNLSDSLTAGDLVTFGPGLAVRDGSVSVTRRDGDVADVFFTLDVSERDRRTWGALGVRHAGAVGLLPDFTFLPRRPLLVPSAVLHGATGRTAPVAPGEIVGLVGTGLGPADAGSGIGDLAVTFDDFPAPILFADETQVAVQVPFEVTGREQVTLRFRYGGLETIESQIEVIPVSPGVTRSVANSDGRQNTADNPAARGSTVILLGTGQGLLDPPLATGQPTPFGAPVGLGEVTATIDGVPATVRRAEMIPGELGIFRIDIAIPADAPTGNAVPLKIVLRGSDRAPEVMVAIR
jgi:uncharacterized protein (TIGR03437 family)